MYFQDLPEIFKEKIIAALKIKFQKRNVSNEYTENYININNTEKNIAFWVNKYCTNYKK